MYNKNIHLMLLTESYSESAHPITQEYPLKAKTIENVVYLFICGVYLESTQL